MKRTDEHPVNIDPDKETAETNKLHMQPGRVEDIENASAHANRTDQGGVTGLRPERARLTQEDQKAEPEVRTSAPTGDARRQDDLDDQPPLTSAANPLA